MRSIQNGQDVYICFVDYEKAFDRVEWRRLLHALRRMGIDWRDRRLIGNLYMGQQMRVRIDGEYSEPGKVGRGVRQGCPLSPLLFNIYIEELVREVWEAKIILLGFFKPHFQMTFLDQNSHFPPKISIFSEKPLGCNRNVSVYNVFHKYWGA